MSKLNIKLTIAGKGYSLTINSDKEEVYRLAEKKVNEYIAEIGKQKFTNFSAQDYLALTALKMAITATEAQKMGEVGSEELQSLSALDDRINDYLNKIEQ